MSDETRCGHCRRVLPILPLTGSLAILGGTGRSNEPGHRRVKLWNSYPIAERELGGGVRETLFVTYHRECMVEEREGFGRRRYTFIDEDIARDWLAARDRERQGLGLRILRSAARFEMALGRGYDIKRQREGFRQVSTSKYAAGMLELEAERLGIVRARLAAAYLLLGGSKLATWYDLLRRLEADGCDFGDLCLKCPVREARRLRRRELGDVAP